MEVSSFLYCLCMKCVWILTYDTILAPCFANNSFGYQQHSKIYLFENTDTSYDTMHDSFPLLARDTLQVNSLALCRPSSRTEWTRANRLDIVHHSGQTCHQGNMATNHLDMVPRPLNLLMTRGQAVFLAVAPEKKQVMWKLHRCLLGPKVQWPGSF